jgi:hypothetical protein
VRNEAVAYAASLVAFDHGEAAPNGPDRPAREGQGQTAAGYQTPGQFAPTVTALGSEKPLAPVPAPQAPGPEGARGVTPALSPVARADELAETLADRPGTAPPTAGRSDPPGPAPQAGTPLAGLVPFDLEKLQRGADDFFALLARLGEGWADGTVATRLVPWLAAVAGAFELARLRKERSPRLAGPGDGGAAGLSTLRPGSEP